ncbi:hypothetical protein T484DRAFT_1831154, partial [Baffinella frigidus]
TADLPSRTSTNLVHQAYHTFVFQQATSLLPWEAAGGLVVEFGGTYGCLCNLMHTGGMCDAASGLVVEFGGGYGCLCNLMHTGGFEGQYLLYDLPVFSLIQTYYLSSNGWTVSPTLILNLMHSGGFEGQYLLYDLPVFSLIQTYYLSSNGWTVRRLAEHTGDFVSRVPGVYTSSDAAEVLAALALRNPSTKEGASGRRKGLFIGMWSLAEAPEEARAPFEDLIRTFSSVLVGFRDLWGGIDNLAYIRRIAKLVTSPCHSSRNVSPRWLSSLLRTGRGVEGAATGGGGLPGIGGEGGIIALPHVMSDADRLSAAILCTGGLM